MFRMFSICIISGGLLACSVPVNIPHEKLTMVYERYGEVTKPMTEQKCVLDIPAAPPLPAVPTISSECERNPSCVEDALVENIRLLRLYAKNRNQQISNAETAYQTCVHK
jgi:hypothetical protein